MQLITINNNDSDQLIVIKFLIIWQHEEVIKKDADTCPAALYSQQKSKEEL